MRRVSTILAVCTFVLGVLVAPAVHRVAIGHCCDTDENGAPCGGREAPAKHDAEHCGVCQLALTPLLTAAPAVSLVPVATAVGILPAPVQAPVARPALRLPFACGPPA